MLLAWGRAILLQLAHPLVAAGVADHSTFRGGPLAAVARLQHTVRAMRSLTFGTEDMQQQTLDTIRGIHRRVHGHLTGAVGIFPAGTPYSAEDPALLLWVHATLLESIPLLYDRLVAPLSSEDRDTYCEDAARIAIELGAHGEEVPRSWASLQRYMESVRAAGCIAVGAQARELAGAVLAPPIAAAVWPAARINRLVTIGLLPAGVREQYGFAWDARAGRRLDRTLHVIRALRRVTPARLAHWPESRSSAKFNLRSGHRM
jgi:uncharacterized protein (DUF2236 family)